MMPMIAEQSQIPAVLSFVSPKYSVEIVVREHRLFLDAQGSGETHIMRGGSATHVRGYDAGVFSVGSERSMAG